jgi:hypothetical protein
MRYFKISKIKNNANLRAIFIACKHDLRRNDSSRLRTRQEKQPALVVRTQTRVMHALMCAV